MLKEEPANGSVLFAPSEVTHGNSKLLLQDGGAFASQPVNQVAGPALSVVFNLSPWSFEKAMVVKQLQPSQHLLRAVPKLSNNLERTKKTVLVDKPDDLAVAFGESHRSDFGGTFETGKAGRFHPPTI